MISIYADRIAALRSSFPTWNTEALLVTNAANRRWLSGFTGSAGVLLVTADRAYLVTDSRYWAQAAEQAPDFELVPERRQPGELAQFWQSAGAATIGFNANDVTVKQAAELQEAERVSWVALDSPIERLREIKVPAEIETITAAAAITDAAMAQVPGILTPGITEVELAWELEKYMRESGASGLAFSTIAAFGTNCARPHYAPAGRALQPGDIVLVDMGARLDGYCSDLTRTFLFGEDAAGRFQEIYGIVLSALNAALEAIKPGMSTREAHLLAAAVIERAGYGEFFSHGLGHGLGLDVHELPALSAVREPQTLEEGMVVTIEPGIYLPDWGGVRIEDLVLLGPDGAVTLSKSPKIPLIAAP
jgi:Xaa-Pro aminopeptidase